MTKLPQHLVDALNSKRAAEAYLAAARRAIETSPTNAAQSSTFKALVTEGLDKSSTNLVATEKIAVKSMIKESSYLDTMMAVTNAENTLRTIKEVREKIVTAILDLMKTQI